MTEELRKLSEEELQQLHKEVIQIRDLVLNFVQKYDFTANQLVSKTFQHEVEKEFGRKYLKRLSKNE